MRVSFNIVNGVQINRSDELSVVNCIPQSLEYRLNIGETKISIFMCIMICIKLYVQDPKQYRIIFRSGSEACFTVKHILMLHEWSPDNSHKNHVYAKILCELSMHRSQWESIHYTN